MTQAASSEDEWTPEFAGQRAPFPAGHEMSMVHGARSERKVGPLAAQLAQDLLTDPDVPPAYSRAAVLGLSAGLGAR